MGNSVLFVESEGCDPFIVENILAVEEHIKSLYGYGVPSVTIPYNDGVELVYEVDYESVDPEHKFKCTWVKVVD